MTDPRYGTFLAQQSAIAGRAGMAGANASNFDARGAGVSGTARDGQQATGADFSEGDDNAKNSLTSLFDLAGLGPAPSSQTVMETQAPGIMRSNLGTRERPGTSDALAALARMIY